MSKHLSDLLSLGSREAVASLLRERAADAARVASQNGLALPDLPNLPDQAGELSPSTERAHQERWCDTHAVLEELEELEDALSDYVFAARALERLEEDELPEEEKGAEALAVRVLD